MIPTLKFTLNSIFVLIIITHTQVFETIKKHGGQGYLAAPYSILWPHSLWVKAGSNGHLTQHDMEAADKPLHDALLPSHVMFQTQNTDEYSILPSDRLLRC